MASLGDRSRPSFKVKPESLAEQTRNGLFGVEKWVHKMLIIFRELTAALPRSEQGSDWHKLLEKTIAELDPLTKTTREAMKTGERLVVDQTGMVWKVTSDAEVQATVEMKEVECQTVIETAQTAAQTFIETADARI
eukprot:CAMPEP_0170450556 /NCGR_PEP_ID=MMETSP0123-20130129/50_1 /TAXON_ID=182087 /ORGANISM="Favella ehrenbergii, Strain Fehren 1" /LENGTH=135 /DNA_ID=CAMNT_0010711871 /DNA_START=75 /DNA_END=482 /DNA_ORIENTATION=+